MKFISLIGLELQSWNFFLLKRAPVVVKTNGCPWQHNRGLCQADKNVLQWGMCGLCTRFLLHFMVKIVLKSYAVVHKHLSVAVGARPTLWLLEIIPNDRLNLRANVSTVDHKKVEDRKDHINWHNRLKSKRSCRPNGGRTTVRKIMKFKNWNRHKTSYQTQEPVVGHHYTVLHTVSMQGPLTLTRWNLTKSWDRSIPSQRKQNCPTQ